MLLQAKYFHVLPYLLAIGERSLPNKKNTKQKWPIPLERAPKRHTLLLSTTHARAALLLSEVQREEQKQTEPRQNYTNTRGGGSDVDISSLQLATSRLVDGDIGLTSFR